MNINVKTLCGVLTANSGSKTYGISNLIYNCVYYHTKTMNCYEMPNNCVTMYICNSDMFT